MINRVQAKRIKWLMLCFVGPEIGLTDWEQKFFASVEKQYKESGSLSPAQFDKLEEVYERAQAR